LSFCLFVKSKSKKKKKKGKKEKQNNNKYIFLLFYDIRIQIFIDFVDIISVYYGATAIKQKNEEKA
jgi:hypothetical protein